MDKVINLIYEAEAEFINEITWRKEANDKLLASLNVFEISINTESEGVSSSKHLLNGSDSPQ